MGDGFPSLKPGNHAESKALGLGIKRSHHPKGLLVIFGLCRACGRQCMSLMGPQKTTGVRRLGGLTGVEGLSLRVSQTSEVTVM